MPLDLVEADLGMARAQPAGVERRELDQPVLLVLRQPAEGKSARLSSARLIAAPTTSRARPAYCEKGVGFSAEKPGLVTGWMSSVYSSWPRSVCSR